ncbi:MAG: hypothetical protein U9Q17_02400 [Chloroflexota bacterium]|nr:hypothetical protein [Chloroflexota bacterium]
MKKLLFPVLALVLLMAGCANIIPSTNQAPVAYIDSVSPSEVPMGETVTFDGHGTDADGSVVAYRWRSSLDDQLSTKSSFESSDLSAGEHIIYFKVQDNNGDWSGEVRSSVKVIALGTVVINFFEAEPEEIAPGESAALSWEVSGATAVSIDKGVGEVDAVDSEDVSPDETTTYTLTATDGSTVVTAKAKVTVLSVEELMIIFFEADPESITSGESSTLSWETTGATEVSIDHGIGEVDPTGSEEVSPTGNITVVYTLTASNDTDSITDTVEVECSEATPENYTVTLTPVINESGYVRSNGQVTPKFMYVGDDNNNIGLQGFMSFDISDIPDDAVIVGVVVDFTDYASALGTPFADLGCLRVYPDDYGTLGSSDYFTETAYGAILKYCSLGDIVVEDDPDVKDALQDKVGDSRFQLRLQFKSHETDGNNDNDIARWMSGYLPKLIVSYYSYE